jgi:REP element-mobilizing transposase RayT
MVFNPDFHYRRSIRMLGWNYSFPGWYFVTICAYKKEFLFGNIVDQQMVCNELGGIVLEEFLRIPERFSNTALDCFVVMPNHVHFVLSVGAIHESPVHEPPFLPVREPTIDFDNIQSDAQTGAIRELPLREKRRKMLLSKMVGYFKMNSAKKINDIRQSSGCPVWQRNYFERIIRDENELQRIQEYILQNPLNWGQDEENPGIILK